MTADAAIRIVLLTFQGCKLHTHDHRLPPSLTTIQEVTARMFTTTLRPQLRSSPRSQLSEFQTQLEFRPSFQPGLNHVGTTDKPPSTDGSVLDKPCSTSPTMNATILFLYLSMHMPNGNPEVHCDSWTWIGVSY